MTSILPQLLANGICAGALYAIVGLGFGIIYRTTRIFHFAHGAVYTTAAYLMYLFGRSLGATWLVATLLALGGAVVCGVLTDVLVYRPIQQRHTSPLAAMIGSFGIYLLVVNLIALLAGNETKVLRPGIDITFQFGTIILTRFQLFGFLSFLAILVSFALFKRTKGGRLLVAFGDNPELVETLGWNTRTIRSSVFAAGSVLAGVAAIVSALDVGMDPHVGMSALLTGAVAVIVGGVRVFEGGVVGGLTLGIIQSLVVWQLSARWMDVFTFAILILFLLFRPQGLLGREMRLEEAV